MAKPIKIIELNTTERAELTTGMKIVPSYRTEFKVEMDDGTERGPFTISFGPNEFRNNPFIKVDRAQALVRGMFGLPPDTEIPYEH